MKIQNITDSVRQCFDKQTGEVLLVKPNEIIEREKIRFEPLAFKEINIDTVENVEQMSPKLLGKKQLNRRNK
jgi:hypothetical protein